MERSIILRRNETFLIWPTSRQNPGLSTIPLHELLSKKLDTLCETCDSKLLSPDSTRALFTEGIVFNASTEILESRTVANCAMCALAYYVVCYAKWGYYRPLFDGYLCDFSLRVYTSEENELRAALQMHEGQGETFCVLSQEDNLASRLNIPKPLEFLDEAQLWLSECINKHMNCGNPMPSDLPARVLELKSEGNRHSLRVIEPRGLRGHYATLSYCWGGKQSAQLTSSNLREYQRQITEATLPQSIQDAIFTTRSLGLAYLWIDAYCIIQDSEEDTEQNLQQMGSIYKNSLVTIQAAGSPSAKSGFINIRKQAHCWALPVRFWNTPPWNGKTSSLLLRHSPYDISECKEPISYRAWTLQEQMLARRILSFPSQRAKIEWYCTTLSRSDSGRIKKPTALQLRPIMEWDSESSEHLPAHRFLHRWKVIVDEYCSRNLTNPGDKLSAIGAIAHEFHRVWGGSYYCGLWGNYLASQLLWKVHWTSDSKSVRHKPQVYRAPSWSWAAIDGSVYSSGYLSATPPLIEIIDVYIELVDGNNVFGPIRNAKLTINGAVKRIQIRGCRVYDPSNNKELGFANLDETLVGEPGSYGNALESEAWCLAVTRGIEEEISDRETWNSEASYDRTESAFLLLSEGGKSANGETLYRRLGLLTDADGRTTDWFEGCALQQLIII